MTRILICFCLLFAITLPCHAQAKPNTLTPKEIADGWILLFDGETTFGWTIKEASKKQALQVSDGALDLSKLGHASIRHSTALSDFEIAFEFFTDDGGDFAMDTWPEPKLVHVTFVPLRIRSEWTPARIRIINRDVNQNIGGRENAYQQDWKGMTKIGFVSASKDNLRIRNIKLRPLSTTSLFNGKDLAGWNVFPGKKSKFAVIDNAINVKDGPGDLQTVGKYKDFVLQLEAISNGKNLNSGVFFRCRDGEYQNGYEAQIHNGFAETPKKYLLEEFDPKTNKLIGKKEALHNASDFGTGAIYRRVPARKQMSKDGEWFGMTVVAQGNHFATWVNGIQVTDWTDNRPKSDNARTGCRLEGGHLSIQGHDPTTDLSFRNFRIAELK